MNREAWYVRLAACLPSKQLNGREAKDQPYLTRYYVMDQNHNHTGLARFVDRVTFGMISDIYLHHIQRSDDTPDFHDHPWPFFHVILNGSYFEQVPQEYIYDRYHEYKNKSKYRNKGHFAFHCARYQHRIQLYSENYELGTEFPVWTLVIAGRKRREWGFIDRVKGCWVHWRAYVNGEKC